MSLLFVQACAGAHSTGALWAQQNLEREAVFFRLSDAQRANQARAFEVSLADEGLSAERTRLAGELADCPGQARPLAASVGDVARDTIRIRVQGDPARQAAVARVALADWRLRRARASGDAQLCELARQTIAGATVEGARPAPTLPIEQLGVATVARDPQRSGATSSGAAAPLVQLSLYASGWADTLRAAAPLPQYLAAVYGGVVVDRPAPPELNGRTPEAVVDELAVAYPDWEPDALYAALGAWPKTGVASKSHGHAPSASLSQEVRPPYPFAGGAFSAELLTTG